MPRRPALGNPEALRKEIIEQLENSAPVLRSGSLRERVQALIPAFLALRSLGAVQMSPEQRTAAGRKEAARSRILRYLQLHAGQVIAGHELMVVSGIGDYPRRVRELRVQYGWPIISGATVNQMGQDDSAEQAGNDLPRMEPDEYILMQDVKDQEAANRWKLANTIRRSKGGVQEKILRYLRENVGKPVTGEELRYVAKNRKEWARRSRELRTEEGWPVATRFSGRPDLPMGVYVLQEDRQAPPHDRHIKEKIRRDVLIRDNYTCRDCGWSHALANPSDVRFIELHHLIHHAKRGENIEENLLTLCNICHDERHSQEKSANA